MMMITENIEAIKIGMFLGLLGCMIGFIVYNEHPDVKTLLLRIFTSLILSPMAFIFSGIWFDDELIRILIAVIAGFIGRPIMRAIHTISIQIAEKPIETATKLSNLWRNK